MHGETMTNNEKPTNYFDGTGICYEQNNESSAYVQVGEILDHLNNYLPLNYLCI